MPRPEFSSKKSGGSAKPRNPFSAWLARRKESREQAEEQAAKMITNDTARNESKIIDTLQGIDFLHSRLPKNVLEAKSSPNQPCGDLEYAAKAIVRMLLKNPQNITVDLRKIDEKLLTLALLFKQAVEQGDQRAAYAAKAGLIRGINDIRSRVPENQPELAGQFVETNASYLDTWITLVGLAQVADRMKQNVESQRALYEAEAEADAKATDELYELLESDPKKGTVFREICEDDGNPQERAKWTKEQREVHQMLIERRMRSARLGLKNLLLQQKELQLTTKVGQVETLYAKVASLPIIADPNLMNKFQEQIDDLFDELARSDAEIDEILRTMDDIDGRIAQMDSAPGAIRAREVAVEEAERAVQEIQSKQKVEAENGDARIAENLKRLGIRSKEAQEELQRQADAEQQRIVEEAMQEEDQNLYN